MIGIDLDKLNLVINKETAYLESVNNSTARLKSIIGNLSDAYSGVTFNSISSVLSKQYNNIGSIDSLLRSYLVLLQSVKKSYVTQEEIFAQQIKNKL